MVGFMYPPRKYLTLSDMFFLSTIAGLELTNPHFPALAELKIIYAHLSAMNYFPTLLPLVHTCTNASLSPCLW